MTQWQTKIISTLFNTSKQRQKRHKEDSRGFINYLNVDGVATDICGSGKNLRFWPFSYNYYYYEMYFRHSMGSTHSFYLFSQQNRCLTKNFPDRVQNMANTYSSCRIMSKIFILITAWCLASGKELVRKIASWFTWYLSVMWRISSINPLPYFISVSRTLKIMTSSLWMYTSNHQSSP